MEGIDVCAMKEILTCGKCDIYLITWCNNPSRFGLLVSSGTPPLIVHLLVLIMVIMVPYFLHYGINL